MFRVIRSFLFFTILIIYTPIHATLCLCCFPFMKANSRYWLARKWCVFSIYLADKLCGVRYKVIGFENLPKEGAIVLSKHQSNWETLGLPTILPKPICYVFKKELIYIPFFGWALHGLNMIHIDRSKGANSFLRVNLQGSQRIKEGAWVLMFPEGTRTPVGDQHPHYKTGGVRLAISAEVPWIVPIAHNAGHFWPRKRFILNPGCITVSIGPPIPVAGKEMKELQQEVYNWIEKEMRHIDPQSYSSS